MAITFQRNKSEYRVFIGHHESGRLYLGFGLWRHHIWNNNLMTSVELRGLADKLDELNGYSEILEALETMHGTVKLDTSTGDGK